MGSKNDLLPLGVSAFGRPICFILVEILSLSVFLWVGLVVWLVCSVGISFVCLSVCLYICLYVCLSGQFVEIMYSVSRYDSLGWTGT